jgi:23S rRNA pseudouridine1911/1915/1917 synthase
MNQTWTATEEDRKKRLDVFITEHAETISRSQVKKMIDAKHVTVNGKVVAVHHFLKPGDVVEVESRESKVGSRREGSKAGGRRQEAEDEKMIQRNNATTQQRNHVLQIIKETPSWIVVYKPCGVLMHPDHDHTGDTLIDAVIKHAPEIAKVGEEPDRPGIVSRLDKDVSGLVVIAKTQKAFDELKRQFAQREVKKIYTALVHGEMEQDEGDIKFRIARSSSKARMSAIPEQSEAGQAAWTHYDTIKRFEGASILHIQILSGRTHQIRAHFFASEHPIVGDVLYKLKKVKRNIQSPRLLLQSTELIFTDPDTKEPQLFTIPLDDDFQAVIETL